MWTLWGMKLLSCSYVVNFTKNCWTNIWSFPQGDRGPQRQLKTQKKKQFLYIAAMSAAIKRYQRFSNSCGRSNTLASLTVFVIPSKHFLVAPESRVDSTTEVQPFLARLGDQGWHMYLSYIIQRMSHRIHQKSLYLPYFTYFCSTKTINHSSR